jgi:hypothetical protein
MKIKTIIAILGTLVAFASCNKNPYHKDVSDIAVNVSIAPFYLDVQNFEKNPSPQNLAKMRQEYGTFFDIFLSDLQRNSMYSDTSKIAVLTKFMQDEWTQELYKMSDSTYKANEDMLSKKIKNAFQYYKFYFPNKEIPKLYAFITGVNYSMAIDSNVIAIGIDKYLGPECSLYKSMNMESYIKRNMYIEKLPTDLMRALAENTFPNSFGENYLLANMIQCGRYQYFMKCMLPDEPDTVLWGFTGKQLEFCQKSEGEFWKYLISTKAENTQTSGTILFSTDYMLQKRFLDDGPFTTVFSKESPARVGQWIGFKIVESFMKNNPEVTLNDLFAISSSKEIMSKAKYNPK